MKTLTLTQPFATLVAFGDKLIETRSWSTKYRGPLAIHAGAGLGPVGNRRGLVRLLCGSHFQRALGSLYGYGVMSIDAMPRGAIVATCELVDCVPSEAVMAAFGAYGPEDQSGGRRLWPLTDQELAFGDYSPGRYAWLLADIKPLDTPIPARGQLGLWDWEGFL